MAQVSYSGPSITVPTYFPYLVALQHGVAVDLPDPGEACILEVVSGQDAGGVGVLHDVHQPFPLPQIEELVVAHVGVGLLRLL
jgi:hypothetical protein